MTRASEELLWYPAFNLKENPFAELDDMTKFHRLVENEAWRQVTSALETQESVVVIGEMGTGKTNMARNILQNKEVQIGLLDRIGIRGCAESIGRNNIVDVKGDLVKTGLIDPTIEKGSKEFFTLLKEKISIFCRLCKESCLRQCLEEKESSKRLESFQRSLRLRQTYTGWEGCQLAERFPYLASHLGELMIIDCPNVLEPSFIKDLDDLVKFWLSLQNDRRALIFCTPEQHRKLTKVSDLFRPEKTRRVELGKPEPQFFYKLVEARIRESGEGERDPKPTIPFKREAITLIAEAVDYNPRQFLKLCSTILTRARQEGRVKPIDEGFLQEIGMAPGEPFMRRIEEAYKAYGDTARNLKLLMEHLLGLEDWISITDQMGMSWSLVSQKLSTSTSETSSNST